MLTELLRGLLLGLVQGVTEFFPVSSSGHLILVPRLLGWPDQGVAFDTILHLGTLTALLWMFRADLQRFAIGCLKGERAARRLVLQILAASVPGILLGGLLGAMIERAFRGPVPVAIDLAFWGLVLLAADRASARRRDQVKGLMQVRWPQALLIGCSQALALLPGTSRSGITMTAGLLAGLDRPTAVAFSFYLSIPTIAAAGAYGLFRMAGTGLASGEGLELAAGFVAALAAGMWAIRFLRSYVARHPLDVFVYYRLALALIVLAVVR